MANQSMRRSVGYVCPVRGCKKKHRRFGTHGIFMHIIDEHGMQELVKRLKLKRKGK